MSDASHLTAFERELVLAFHRVQQRFERGELGPTSTVWSHVQYLVARPRGHLRPSPVPGKHNIERHFETRLRRAVDRLVRAGLLRRRRLDGYKRQFREQLGYKLHASRASDFVLTTRGRALAEQLDPAHSDRCVHASEEMVAIAPAGVAADASADGTCTLPCPPPDADGHV